MSGRIQSFNDKMRPLTEAEIASMEHLRTKGKVVKNEILTPDELKTKDTFGLDQNEIKINQGQNIITEKDIQKEEEERLKEEERFGKDFQKQLKEWSKKKESEPYKDFEFDGDYYLVRVFEMDVSNYEGYSTIEYEYSQLLKTFKLVNKALKENVFPIVKILKVGRGFSEQLPQLYKEGDVCLVQSDDIIGDDWNPKFLHYMQFQETKGMKPILPEGMRQRIPKIEVNWAKFKFLRPWVRESSGIDNVTFLIPSSKIKGYYNL